MNFIQELHVFLDVSVHRKHEICASGPDLLYFPGLSGALLIYALVLIGRTDRG